MIQLGESTSSSDLFQIIVFQMGRFNESCLSLLGSWASQLWILCGQTHLLRKQRYCLCGLIFWVRVVPRRTVVGVIDRRFDNLSGSHHQSNVNFVSSVYGICLWSAKVSLVGTHYPIDCSHLEKKTKHHFKPYLALFDPKSSAHLAIKCSKKWWLQLGN